MKAGSVCTAANHQQLAGLRGPGLSLLAARSLGLSASGQPAAPCTSGAPPTAGGAGLGRRPVASLLLSAPSSRGGRRWAGASLRPWLRPSCPPLSPLPGSPSDQRLRREPHCWRLSLGHRGPAAAERSPDLVHGDGNYGSNSG